MIHGEQVEYKKFSPAEQRVVEAEWDEMRMFPCSYCGAVAGEFCRNQFTGLPFGHGPGHHARIVAAARA